MSTDIERKPRPSPPNAFLPGNWRAMRKQQKTKQAMARELHTSRSQLDRLLDPRNTAVSLDTITRAAKVLGKRVILRIANPRMAHQRSRSPRKASAR